LKDLYNKTTIPIAVGHKIDMSTSNGVPADGPAR
jgi:hypothetical protein